MSTVVRIRGLGFALVNLPVVLVYGYGRGPYHLDFCKGVGFPDRQRVRGLGLRPFVVYPPSCRGGGFHTTTLLLRFRHTKYKIINKPYYCQYSFIHSAVCLKTGPLPLPKPVLYTVRFSTLSFNFQYLCYSLRTSSSFVSLLPRLSVTFTLPSIVPSAG